MKKDNEWKGTYFYQKERQRKEDIILASIFVIIFIFLSCVMCVSLSWAFLFFMSF